MRFARTAVHALSSFVLLAASGLALAVPEPDDIAGPPPYTINGCPAAAEFTPAIVSEATGLTPAEVDRLMRFRNFTLTDLCILPTRMFARALSRIETPKFAFPDKAAKQRRLQQAGDDGLVLAAGPLLALQQREAMIAPRADTVAGIRGSDWTAIGPGNVGGRIRAISPHPSNASDLLVGSVSGGLWKSRDAGASFEVVNDFLLNVAISSIARAPSNPSIIYAGTGELFTGDGIRGLGIFKSTDGGSTWSHLAATMPPADPFSTHQSDFYAVNRVAVHPTNPNIVVAATLGQYGGWGGLWRSQDGGTTWQKVYARGVMDVRFDTNSPNRVVVGEGFHYYWDGSTYLPDGGGAAVCADITTAVTLAPDPVSNGSFVRTKLNGSGDGRVEVAFAPATPGLIVAVLDQNAGEFYFTNNAGTNWHLNSTPAHLATQGNYDNALWVDPTDSRRVVVGGIDLFRGAGAASWWTSTSPVAPLAWTKVSSWQYGGSYGPSAHADHHAIVPAAGYDGVTNRNVYFGNDGGLYRGDVTAINGDSLGTGWTNLNNGLAITQFYGGAGKNFGGTVRIVGGTQDNGSVKWAGTGTNWTSYFGGDGGWAAVDPTDSNVFYGEYVFASVTRTTTNGFSTIICNGTAANTNNISEGLGGASYCGTAATSEANFIAPFILDPNNANTMLVGAKSLWRSTAVKAAAPAWAVMKPPTAATANFISAIAVAPGNSNLIWVGHNNGELYCTTNGTAGSPTWTQVTSPAARYAMRLMVDQDNNNRVFATFGGYSHSGAPSPNVHETTSGCVASPAWTSRHANLPYAPVRSIVRHPSNASWLYVSTEVGVFASINGGTSWSATSDGPGSVSTDELFWIDNSTLVAATHGRGMFKATISPGVIQWSAPTLSAPESGGTASLTLTRTGGSAGAVGVTVNTTAGTATAGSDFFPITNQTVSWADGDTASKTVSLVILADPIHEGHETLTATISNPTGNATLGANSVLAVTIIDDDAPPARPDFDPDGKSDLAWQHTDGRAAIWLMNGFSATATSEILAAGTGFAITHLADFNGDGRTDILWSHADGRAAIWLMNGSTPTSTSQILNAGTGWTAIHAADFDADGKADIVWQHTDGSVAIWLMNGATLANGAGILGAATGWSVTKVGDFDGNGKADLYWQHSDGRAAIWLMNGLLPAGTNQILNAASGWTAVHVADLNGDGKSDLVWQHTDGSAAAWLMNGSAMASGAGILGAGTGWSVARTADFNGDLKKDLYWQHTDGRAAIWLMDGLAPIRTAQILNAASGWSLRRIAELNGDGKADIVWQHTDGSVAAWLMNGEVMSSGSGILGAGTGWSVSTASP